MKNYSSIILCLIFSLLFISCDKNDSETSINSRYYQFVMRSDTSSTFVVETTIDSIIAIANSQLSLPDSDRNLFLIGEIIKGQKIYNAPWSWHFVPSGWTFAEITIELCDGSPSYIEENLDEWIDQVGVYCPWSAYLKADVTADYQ